MFNELKFVKKVYFIILIILACVAFFFSFKFFKQEQKEYAWGLVGLGTILLMYSMYVLLNKDNMKTCEPDMWKKISNVILPYDIGTPKKTNVSLCEAQLYAQTPGFYFDGSNLYTVNDLEKKVQISNVTTNFSFYYLKDEDVNTNPVSTSTTTSSTVSTTSSPVCCFRNENDSCTTFEKTFLGNVINANQKFKNLFTQRAGKVYGTKTYIGDFTVLESSSGKTNMIYEETTDINPTRTEQTKEIPSFNWSTCSPDFIKNMKPRMLSNIEPQNEKIVKVDSWLIRSIVDQYIYLAKNGSPNSFYVVRDAPWKNAMEIKGEYEKDLTIRYNNVIYTGMTSISTSLRNILIAE